MPSDESNRKQDPAEPRFYLDRGPIFVAGDELKDAPRARDKAEAEARAKDQEAPRPDDATEAPPFFFVPF